MREEAQDAAEMRLNRLLNLILETAVDAMGFDAATASMRQGENLTTIGATDQRLLALDEAQYASGEGPCLAVLDRTEPVVWTDQDDESRWQAFREAAEHMGVVRSLSLHVPTDDASEIAASLNMYGRTHRVLEEQQLCAAERFAEQLSAAMQSVDAYRATARLATGLAEAMRTRAVIEQAKGILMNERNIDAEEAFSLLVSISQNSNVKLREVARRLVDARTSKDAPEA
jgi:GAF domain-containing protein